MTQDDEGREITEGEKTKFFTLRRTLNLFCEGVIDGDLREAEDVVGEAHDVDQDEEVDEAGFFVAEGVKVFYEVVADLAFFVDGGLDDLVDDLPFFSGWVPARMRRVSSSVQPDFRADAVWEARQYSQPLSWETMR